jgi:hypothetical protein
MEKNGAKSFLRPDFLSTMIKEHSFHRGEKWMTVFAKRKWKIQKEFNY